AADGELKAWLFQIARNLVVDHHRKRLRHPEPSVLIDEGVRSPSQDVDLAVNEALAALTDLDRDVFLMREVAGLSYEEIARACGLTPDAVRSRLHRARLQPRGFSWRALVGVAAVLVALVGGYLAGQRRSEVAMSAAPPATRVVQAPATWKNVPSGRMP